jgi:hypothetical protein
VIEQAARDHALSVLVTALTGNGPFGLSWEVRTFAGVPLGVRDRHCAAGRLASGAARFV